MENARAEDAENRGENRGERAFVLVVMVALLLVRLPLLFHRVYDPDELEHVHAAWSLFKGLVPYRDFFEHHTPLYYFVLAPFFSFFQVDQSYDSARHFLSFARGLSLVLTVAAVLLLARVVRLGGSRRAGWLAGLFLLMQPVLNLKTLEVRPDVPAMVLFLAGLWFFRRALDAKDELATVGSREAGGARRTRWPLALSVKPFLVSAFAGGLFFGGAILCTQKALFALPGAFLALGLWALAGGRERFAARCLAVVAALVGVALPVLLTWAGFALVGGGHAFVFNNFLLNARWKVRSSRHFLITLRTSWPMLLFALVGAGVAIRDFVATRFRAFGAMFLLSTMTGLFAGLLVLPAAFRQYYLLPLPIACAFAGEGVAFLAGRVRRARASAIVVAVVVVLLAWPIYGDAKSFGTRNDAQLRQLRFVLAHTQPTDLVLEGFSGAQVFRPHPLYYGFIHREIQAALSDAELDAYFRPLETGAVRPALIHYDPELKALGPRFEAYLRAHYTSVDGELFWPKNAGPSVRGSD